MLTAGIPLSVHLPKIQKLHRIVLPIILILLFILLITFLSF